MGHVLCYTDWNGMHRVVIKRVSSYQGYEVVVKLRVLYVKDMLSLYRCSDTEQSFSCLRLIEWMPPFLTCIWQKHKCTLQIQFACHDLSHVMWRIRYCEHHLCNGDTQIWSSASVSIAKGVVRLILIYWFLA